MVSPPDFLYSCGDINHYGGDPFNHFCHFFIFNSFDDTICLCHRLGLVPKSVVNQQFYSHQLFPDLVHTAMKMFASVIAMTGEGSRLQLNG
jgi:hypothetical protein